MEEIEINDRYYEQPLIPILCEMVPTLQLNNDILQWMNLRIIIFNRVRHAVFNIQTVNFRKHFNSNYGYVGTKVIHKYQLKSIYYIRFLCFLFIFQIK